MKLPQDKLDRCHQEMTEALAAQIKEFYKQRRPFKVYHGSTNSTRVLSFDRNAMVDISHFNRVISVDESTKTAVVEPNVPMDKLVDATLAHGLVPPVVMEFPGITVGGGLQGGAGESSSFKWGTFNRTLNWYDIMLADGEVLRASPKKHADLYWGAAGAYGSLGIVTAAAVKLTPAKRYVNVTYMPVGSFAEATSLIRKLTKQPYEYVDAILYSPDCGVIIAGKLSDKPHGSVQTFSKRRDPWFYLHAEKIARLGKVRQESVPLRDYLFRYDRGAFWMGKYAFERFKVPFKGFARWAMDSLFRTRRMYDALQASGVSQECIIQDLAIPASRAVEFLELIDQEFGFYPIWLCPLLPDNNSPLLSSAIETKAIINIGVWALYRKPYDEIVRANRKLEQVVQKLGGKKWLYAHSFYAEKQFWALYDKPRYDALRTKYKAQTLPDLFQKISYKPARVSAKHGLLYAMLGRNGIRIK